MIFLKNETVKQIIADIMGKGCEWKPNGGVAEGYRINVGKSIDDIGYFHILIERLRIRMNTVERILNAPHLADDAMRYWRFVKVNTPFWELRIYDGYHNPCRNYPCVKNIRLFDEITDNHRDGYMSLGEYLLMRAYETERTNDPTGDFLNDFAQDMKLQDEYYADSVHLYCSIGWPACSGCIEALDAMVTDYRKYCQEKGLEFDHFKTFNEEANEEEEE